jgi:UDP-N-acetyl-D-mannosaminuronic acid dehydrogenase
VIVSVIGLGYIGLPTAALLASRKIKVIGIDIDESVVETINKGMIHIVEPELSTIVKESVETGYFCASTIPVKADVFIISVPTPFTGHKVPDISYIESASRSISPVLEKGNLVILESTSPVGTTEKMLNIMEKERPDLNFPKPDSNNSSYDVSIAHCPERVLPGKIVRELVDNDRIIGGITDNCSNEAKKLYEIFVDGGIFITDVRTAELCKLVENSYRDVNIAFANELSLICEKLNVDIWSLIELANCHPRVNILQPGPGVGGHCIAVDPWFIVNSAPDESKLISTARKVNDNKPKHIINQINTVARSIAPINDGINIACLGLSFKADIDDLRESPAVNIVKSLICSKFNRIYLVEPHISKIPEDMSVDFVKLVPMREGIEKSDIVIILVDHSEFKSIDKKLLTGKNIIDTRGVMHPRNII